MPPPAPIKPQIKPTAAPQKTDSAARRPLLLRARGPPAVMTGLRMNLRPSSRVINTEKPPMAVLGIREAA